MLVRGGRVVDPTQELDRRLDVRLAQGIVAEIAEHLEPSDEEEVLDAGGAYVAPGFIDMHVHLREPGFPQKETILSGASAAVAGGFTAVACMPNTNPAIDTAQVIEHIARAAAHANLARIYPIAAITRGRHGAELLDYASLEKVGAVAFSDDGQWVEDPRVLFDAAGRARDLKARFISHCEDERLKRDGAARRAAEDVVVARDLVIAQHTGKAWHIAHLSTAGALGLMRWARSSGIDATCEVTPHHLYFTEDLAAQRGGAAKVNPPLRTSDDVAALREGVYDGTIDAFASDHAPHTAQEKAAGFAQAAPGFSALEVAAGAYALALPALPVARYVELLSTNPARILGVGGGTLKVGTPADITVFADRAWTVESARFYSKGRFTPFEGLRLPRRAIATLVGGRLLMRDGEIRT